MENKIYSIQEIKSFLKSNWMNDYFDKFNNEYFDGKLAKGTIWYNNKLRNARGMFEVRGMTDEVSVRTDYKIYISPKYMSKERYLATLLHEMIHLYVCCFYPKECWYGKEEHGTMFKKIAKELTKKSGLPIYEPLSDDPKIYDVNSKGLIKEISVLEAFKNKNHIYILVESLNDYNGLRFPPKILESMKESYQVFLQKNQTMFYKF